MIRVFQRTMHNRAGPAVESREIDGLRPGRDRAAGRRDRRARRLPELRRAPHRAGDDGDDREASPAAPSTGGQVPMTAPLAAVQAPVIDYKALSPLFATRRRLDRRADGRPVPRPLRAAACWCRC